MFGSLALRNASFLRCVPFSEKAFVTYYNAKLKEGYENFHSFVKLAREKQPGIFPELSQQAYNKHERPGRHPARHRGPDDDQSALLNH